MATGVFMSTLDSSMVNIALPAIMKNFHSPMAATEMVVLIYLLTITSTLLFWGHLGDRFGRGRIYGLGMLIFACGSLACTLSTTLFFLVVSRFGQALGAAMLMSTGPAIVKASFPPEQLGRTMGLIGVAVSLGLMSGPSLGGFLIEYFSWRSLFLITVPIGLIFSILAIRFIPMTRPPINDPIDWAGAILWTTILLIITVTLNHMTEQPWPPTTAISLLLLAGALTTLFITIERTKTHPMLPLDLFNSRYFSMGIISAVLSFTTMFMAIMLTPFYLDRLRELPPSSTGLIMMALPSAILLISPLAGRLADHFEKRLIATAGLLLSATAALMLSTNSADSSFFSITTHLALIGAGQALFLSPNSAAVLNNTLAGQAGSAAALLATARNLGMLMGIALATLAFTVIFSSQTAGLDMKDFNQAYSTQFIIAFRGALRISAAIGFLSVLASWTRGKEEKHHRGE